MGNDPGYHHLFIGTYTKGGSEGIYTVALDRKTGALGLPEVAAAAPNPTFIALSPQKDFLYAVCASPEWASSFRVDPATRRLSPVQQSPAGTTPTPCYIAVHPQGRVAAAANYHLALAAALPLTSTGAIGTPRVIAHTGSGPNPDRQATAHVHSTTFSPDGRFVIVCDLGLDRVYSYQLDADGVGWVPADPAFVAAAPGAGPRHTAFGPTGRCAYVINEMGNTVVVYDYDALTGELAPQQTVSVLPPNYRGESTAAAIRIHPSGKFAYASARGPNSLAVFAVAQPTGRLSPIEVLSCGGNGPRDFAISPDGKWLLCAHQDSNTLCTFQIDASSGKLRRIPGTVAVSMPVCAVFLD